MEYVSDKDLARRYNVRRETVWRWVKIGSLPKPIRITGGTTRWKLSEIEAFEERHEALR